MFRDLLNSTRRVFENRLDETTGFITDLGFNPTVLRKDSEETLELGDMLIGKTRVKESLRL